MGSSAKARLAIHGTVLGPKGPLPGARVLASAVIEGESLSTLRCEDSSELLLLWCGEGWPPAQLVELVQGRHGEAVVHARAVSAEDGSFSLEELEDGSYALWAESPEGIAFLPAVAAGSESVELRIGSGTRLSGTVTDDAKVPVPGALVTVVLASHSRFFEALTDEAGRYQLGPLPPGRFMAVVEKEGLEPAAARLWLYTEDARDFTLERPGRVTGRVLLASAPVAGAKVQLLDDFDEVSWSLTDEAGRFTFDGLRRTRYSLRVDHEGKGAMTLISLGKGEPEALDVLLELTPAAFIEGVVRDEAQRAVPAARVRASWEDWGAFEPVEDHAFFHDAFTDEAGRYRLGPIPPGVYSLEVTAPQYLSASEEARPFAVGVATLDFIQRRADVVEGVLEDSQGLPIRGEIVELYAVDPPGAKSSHLTESDGRFSFTVEKRGKYRLEVRGRRLRPLEMSVTVPTEFLRVRGERLPRIMGEVVDEVGAPLPEVAVGIWDEQADLEEGPLDGDSSDGDGRFELSVEDAGRYRITAELFSKDLLRTASQVIEVDGRSEARVRLRFEEGRRLSGRVVDWWDRPVPRVGVQLQPAPRVVIRRMGRLQPGMETDADGRFGLGWVSGEQFDACIQGDVYSLLAEVHGDTHCTRVKNDGQEIRLVVGRGVFVTGRLVHPDGSPVTHYRVNGREVRREDGEISVPVVHSGTERIELSAPGLQPVLRLVPDFPEGVQIQDLGTIVMSP